MSNTQPAERSCPSCGGPAMRLDASGDYECRYCGSRFDAPSPAAPAGARPRGITLPANLSRAALVSLIAGIVAWSFIPIAGALVAVVAGVKGLRETRASGGSLTGGWLATIGLLLGASQLLLGVLFIALFVVAALVATPS